MRLFSAEDETPRWMYVLSDAYGPPTPWGVLNGEGAVLSRVSFTPYGTVLRATMDGSTTWQDAWPVVGYQGLWGTRLDDKTGPPPSTGSGGGFGETPWGQWQTSPSGSDGLVAGHQPDAPRHVYDARNRAYMPWLGRWLQPDPLGTGLPVAASMRSMGEVIGIDVNDVSVEAIFHDGANRYEFVKSNPIAGTDAMGLSWDPFDMIDEIISEHEFSQKIAITKLNAAISDRKLLGAIRAYERAAWNWSDMVWDRDVSIVIGLVGGLPFSRACFVEGTPVATPCGHVAIDKLCLGDEVASRPDPDGPPEQHDLNRVDPALNAARLVVITLSYQRADGSTTWMEFIRPEAMAIGLKSGDRFPVDIKELYIKGDAKVESVVPCERPIRRNVPVVTGRFITDSADIVDVVLENQVCKPEDADSSVNSTRWTLGATPAHPIYSLTRKAWVEAGNLIKGERVATQKGEAVVENVTRRSDRASVYNLEISRWHTYFAGQGNAWVHNSYNEVPRRIVKVPGTGSLGGAAYRAPDGTVYLGIQHIQIQEYLLRMGIWKTLGSPGVAGWAYGWVNTAGRFLGDLF